MKYIDLTHTVVSGMPVYPGDTAPEIVKIADIGTEGHTNYQMNTGMHAGTHIDGPLHMLENGKRLSQIAVESFFGRGRLIDARGMSVIDTDLLSSAGIKKGDIVLVLTGFSKGFWQADYFETYPEVSEGFAKKLVELGVKIVGIDSPSPDRSPFLVHKILLSKEILIIENLTNLEALLGVPHFEIIALPPKFDTEAAPTRVIARIDSKTVSYAKESSVQKT